MGRVALLVSIALLWGLGTSTPAAGQSAAQALARGRAAVERQAYGEAVQLFKRARRSKRLRPEALYELARLYVHAGVGDPYEARRALREALRAAPEDLRYLSLRLELYRSDTSNADAHLFDTTDRVALARRILARDPDHVVALEELSRGAYDALQGLAVADARLGTGVLDRRLRDAYREAHDAIGRVLARDPRRLSAYHQMMRLYTYADDYQPALAALEPMRRHFPALPETWLYHGVAYHHLGLSEQAAASFDRALALMPEPQRRPYDDLSGVLTADERAAYTADSAAFGRHFWARRDPRFLTAGNERRNEHLARIVYADLQHTRDGGRLRGSETERGEVLIRYGKPNDPLVADARYGGFYDYGDFTLGFDGLSLTSPPASAPPEVMWQHDYVIRARDVKRRMPERYHHREPGRRVDLPYLASTFKGPAGRTVIHVAYGIPLTRVDSAAREIDLSLETGVFLVGDTGVVASARRRHDGLPVAQVLRAGDVRVWADQFELEAAPGAYDLSVEFETAGGGTVGYQRQALPVPSYGGDSLKLSALLPAYDVAEHDGTPPPGRLVRGGLAITPVPLGVFVNDQPVHLYFEVYDLAQEADGRTRYAVEAALVEQRGEGALRAAASRLFGRGRAAGVSVTFEQAGTTADDAVSFVLDARSEQAGTYELVVRVTDRVSGRTAHAVRTILLE